MTDPFDFPKMSESKVVFLDGQRPRVLRGQVDIDAPWVVIRRTDGTWRIPQGQVLKIETLSGDTKAMERVHERDDFYLCSTA